MRKVQQGFTLIELMIVVAIIGILAAIAIPAYQDYTIRAQVTEGLTMAASLKTSVSEFYADRGSWPAGLGNLGIAAASTAKYVAGVNMDTGTINVVYGVQANANIGTAGSNTLSIRPLVSNNNDVIWVCGNRAVPAGAADPASGASSANITDIVTKYLPSNCRL